MGKRWFYGAWVVWMAVSSPAFGGDAIPADPLPIERTSFLRPEDPRGRPERPTDLPNVDTRTDLPPLIRPPTNSTPPARPLRRPGAPSNYDPSYLYLPEQNPGMRQAPCPCLPLGRWWINTSYFLGVTQNDTVPALATTGGTGIPGGPGVTTVHGSERLDHSFRSGFRLESGLWLDRCQNWGVDGSFFFMESTNANFSAASTGDSILARPFISQPGSRPSASLLAGPTTGAGGVNVDSPLHFLGADVNSRHTLFCEDVVRLDFLAGYRFIQMSESISVRARSEGIDGSLRDIQDRFTTRNLFNGGQVGLAGEYRWERLILASSMKVAFGVNSSELNIEGGTLTSQSGIASTNATGFLTRSSNIGQTHQLNFAVVPEVNFNIGYQLSDNWRASLGYTFIYVSKVARPGQAIDTTMGTSADGIMHPLRNDPIAEFWMHGINFGIEARY